MCYHSQRRSALAELEHETEANAEREQSIESEQAVEANSSENPEMTDRRPEPLGHA